MQIYQKKLIAHACLVLIVALLAGFMLGIGLIGGIEFLPGLFVEFPSYGTAAGWARAHAGGITNGLLMIGVALVLPHCNLAEMRARRFAWGLIIIGWVNTLFYWLGNASANRALSFTDNAQGVSNIFGFIGYGVALIPAFIALYILAVMAWGLFKSA